MKTLNFLYMTFLVVISVLAPNLRAGLEDDAKQLRQLFYQVVQTTATENPSDQAQEMRAVLASHPEVLLWFAEGRDINEILQASKVPNAEALNESLNKIQDLGYSFKKRIKNIPNSYLKIFNINKTIEDYKSYSQSRLVQELLKTSLNPTDISADDLQNLSSENLISQIVDNIHAKSLDQLNSISYQDRVSLLENVPDTTFNNVATKINQAISDIKFSEIPAVQMMKDPRTGFDLSNLSPKMANFFELLITKYFDDLPISDKRQLTLGVLELEPNASHAKMLSSILNNSGPALQKLFQLIGNDVKSEMLKEVMDELKSNIKTFPTQQAKEIISKSYDTPIEDMFSKFGDKPIAAASVGQVYLATLKGQNDEIIIKVMRPGLQARAEREIQLLKDLAPDKGLQQIVENLEASLMEELDFTIEGQNMIDGKIYNTPSKGVFAVDTIEKLPPTTHVLAMEKAPGTNISKIINDNIDKKSAALKNFLSIWFDESLFKSGFFHGDLHGGNIFLETGDAVKLGTHSSETDYKLTAIDFGSSAKFDRKGQQNLIKLILGGIFQVGPLVESVFKSFGEQTRSTELKMHYYIKRIFKNSDGDFSEDLNNIINKAIALEIKLPNSLLMFNRGRSFLEKQISDLHVLLDEVDPDNAIERPNTATIYRDVFIKRVAIDLVKSLVRAHSDEESLVKKKTREALINEYFAPKAKEMAYKTRDCIVQSGLEYLVDLTSFFNEDDYSQDFFNTSY